MFKYITSFHSEMPQKEAKVIKAELPVGKFKDEIVIEPWIRRALDQQNGKLKGGRRIG